MRRSSRTSCAISSTDSPEGSMRSRWLGPLLAAVALALSLWAYPHLPERIATHWNVRGQPNGYSSRTVAVLMAPLLMLAVSLLFRVLPRLDPRGANYAKFIVMYWLLANTVVVFLLGVHALLLAQGVGLPVRMTTLLFPGTGLLLVCIGNYLSRVEPNWFVGIRTPWT